MCMVNIIGTCILAAQLTHVDVSSNANHLPHTAYSYDGVARDVSKFYKPTEKSISAGLDVYLKNTKISLYHDTGIKTMKYEKGDSTSIGVNHYIPLDDKFSLNLSGSYAFIGKETDTPCTDNYGREYYCGTATSWQDHSQTDVNDQYNVGIKLSYKF